MTLIDKVVTLPNGFVDQGNPIKIPTAFFEEMEKPILKFTQNSNSHGKGFQTGKTVLKKNKVKGLTLLNFKTHYKATVIKSMWYKERHTEQ